MSSNTGLAVSFDSGRVVFGELDVTDQVRRFIISRIQKQLGSEFHVVVRDFSPASAAFHVRLSPFHPLIDCDAIRKCIAHVKNDGSSVIPIGCIHGTGPTRVSSHAAEDTKGEAKRISVSNLMATYRTCFDVRRQKRLKLFLKSMLEDRFFIDSAVKDIAIFFETPVGIELVLRYGEQVQFSYLEKCPNCGSPGKTPLRTSIGWPRIGFLTANSEYYSQCHACSLIFLNPAYGEADAHLYYDDADSERAAGSTQVSRFEIENANYLANFKCALESAKARFDKESFGTAPKLLDVGGGEGAFASLARRTFEDASITCIDFKENPNKALLESNGIETVAGNAIDYLQNIRAQSLDCVTAFEVIEHLHLASALKLLKGAHQALKNNGLLILSTPDFGSRDSRLTDFWAAYPPQHLFVYNRQELRNLLEANGFRDCRFQWRSYPFRSNDTEINYYRDCYEDVSPAIAALLTQLQQANAERLAMGSSAGTSSESLGGDGEGAELIVVARRATPL